MYKVMIAEDEELILNGIKDMIDWESLGLEVVHLVHDGVEAMEAWKKEEVQIVITDINMPRMGGLELLSKLRSINKEMRFIILSGYDEFEYARTAIRIGVEEYILKPIDEELLMERLEKTVLKLNQKNEYKKEVLEFNNKLSGFLEGKMAGVEKEKYIKELQFAPSENAIVPAVVKVNIKNGTKIYDVISHIEDLDKDQVKILYHFKNQIIILKAGGDKEYFMNLQNQLESRNNIETFISVGDGFTEFYYLPKIYKKMKELQKYFIIEGYGKVVDEGYLTSRKYTDIAIDGTKLHKLIMEKNREEAVSYLEDLFINNANTENISVEHIYRMAFKIAVILQDITVEFKLKEGTARSMTELVEELYKAENISSIKDIFIVKISNMIDQLQVDDFQYTPVIKQIISEITDYYKEDMNLKTLAHKFHMNTSYLGQIFQREVGCSFSQYLSNAKNSKARDLILNTNMKINDIAKEVGYPDTSYFYRKFKQCYGVSPASLREMKNY